jgi:hypothetical protein
MTDLWLVRVLSVERRTRGRNRRGLVVRLLLVRRYPDEVFPRRVGFFEMLLGELTQNYWSDSTTRIVPPMDKNGERLFPGDSDNSDEDKEEAKGDFGDDRRFQSHIESITPLVCCGEDEESDGSNCERWLPGSQEDVSKDCWNLQAVYDIALDDVGADHFHRRVERRMDREGVSMVASTAFPGSKRDGYSADTVEYGEDVLWIKTARDRPTAGAADEDGEHAAAASQLFDPSCAVVSRARSPAPRDDVEILRELASGQLTDEAAVAQYVSTIAAERDGPPFVIAQAMNPAYCRLQVMTSVIPAVLNAYYTRIEHGLDEKTPPDQPPSASTISDACREAFCETREILRVAREALQRESRQLGRELHIEQSGMELLRSWEQVPEFFDGPGRATSDDAFTSVFAALKRAW